MACGAGARGAGPPAPAAAGWPDWSTAGGEPQAVSQPPAEGDADRPEERDEPRRVASVRGDESGRRSVKMGAHSSNPADEFPHDHLDMDGERAPGEVRQVAPIAAMHRGGGHRTARTAGRRRRSRELEETDSSSTVTCGAVARRQVEGSKAVINVWSSSDIISYDTARSHTPLSTSPKMTKSRNLGWRMAHSEVWAWRPRDKWWRRRWWELVCPRTWLRAGHGGLSRSVGRDAGRPSQPVHRAGRWLAEHDCGMGTVLLVGVLPCIWAFVRNRPEDIGLQPMGPRHPSEPRRPGLLVLPTAYPSVRPSRSRRPGSWSTLDLPEGKLGSCESTSSPISRSWVFLCDERQCQFYDGAAEHRRRLADGYNFRSSGRRRPMSVTHALRGGAMSA